MADTPLRAVPAGGAPDPAVAIAERVLDGIDTLVLRLGEAYQDVPEYGALGPDGLAARVLPSSRRLVFEFFTAVAAGLDADPASIPEARSIGRARLEMGIPLEPMLHVYRIAGRLVWYAIVEVTRAGEEPALADLGARWMDYIDEAASLATATYLSASHERLRAVDARRRALLDALLAARTPAEVAAVSIQFSTALAGTYVPVLLDGPGVGVAIDAVLAAAPAGTVGGARSSDVLLLVPAATVEVSRLVRAAGPAVAAYGSPAAPGPELLAEVGHAEQLLAAARAQGHTSGTFGPDDLLVEQLLHADERVAATLRRRVVDALAGRDHDGLVTATVRTYLSCGSIPETARHEHVHPNTVLYRLRRVTELTGLDPRVPVDATQLVLALQPRRS